jgi:hypothetical protein
MSISLLDGLLNNASLTFQVGDGTITTDLETGNPIESTTPVTISCKLDQRKEPSFDPARTQPRNLPGIYMEGYAIDPAIIPTSIARDAVATANINGLIGKFHMVPKMQLAALEVLGFTELTGQKIAGYFEAD